MIDPLRQSRVARALEGAHAGPSRWPIRPKRRVRGTQPREQEPPRAAKTRSVRPGTRKAASGCPGRLSNPAPSEDAEDGKRKDLGAALRHRVHARIAISRMGGKGADWQKGGGHADRATLLFCKCAPVTPSQLDGRGECLLLSITKQPRQRFTAGLNALAVEEREGHETYRSLLGERPPSWVLVACFRRFGWKRHSLFSPRFVAAQDFKSRRRCFRDARGA